MVMYEGTKGQLVDCQHIPAEEIDGSEEEEDRPSMRASLFDISLPSTSKRHPYVLNRIRGTTKTFKLNSIKEGT